MRAITLEDQIGTALNGNHTFSRFNPIIGGTYKITPELTAYAGYSEANRAPTPLELGCADPAHPCIIAAFLVSDPPLKQVVSRTVEAGLRGTQGAEHRHARLEDRRVPRHQCRRHPRDSEPGAAGIWLFPERRSRRAARASRPRSISNRRRCSSMRAMRSSMRASSMRLQVGSNSPFADADGNVQILPGNRIPAIPRNRIKAGIDYSVTDAFKVGGDALFVGSQYFVGDESNQAARLPSYAVFNLHSSYQINKTFQIYGRVDNIFDNRYATYGTFFDTSDVPNFANGGAPFTDARSVSPARPRAFYAGLKATF